MDSHCTLKPCQKSNLKPSFLEAVKADAGLQEKLKAAGDADAVVAIAKAAGFVISADELQSAPSRWDELKPGVRDLLEFEISEQELEGVAGGSGRCVCKTRHVGGGKLIIHAGRKK